MFNSINNSYGGIRPTAIKSASGPNALSKVNNAQKPNASAEVQKAQQEPAKPIDKPAVIAAVKKLNETVAPALQTVEFELDEESEQMVVKVRDKTTREIIRQMPNEEALAFSKTIDKLQGLVIRQTA
jgi:flagellar protein FlaG